jgi:site-specific DNA-methyltransferase (adenine-specific)
MDTNRIITGDAFDALPDLSDESIHAAVTDPPYGLAFMGRDWDDFEPKEYQEWCERWAREVKRVLKPGGHLLAFSGNRTHHRLFTGVEDAGFEIRDTLTWHYGSGFPKASDVSKTIDKRADAEREVIADEPPDHLNGGAYTGDGESDKYGDGLNTRSESNNITAPATDAAKEWDGWKTGLKPATEFVVMARKPFDGATVDSVLEHGTGALNIDACRVGDDGGHEHSGEEDNSTTETCYGDGLNGTNSDPVDKGRYPANVVFDETAADALDEQVGELAGGARTSQSGTGRNTSDAPTRNDPDERIELKSGGPSRYFYTSKASRSERTENGAIENDHPTVKPRDLMEWLIKLVTREGQTILDPFAGSGTTCLAAKELHREFIGIERQAKYADVARVRCGLDPDDPSVVREDGQGGIEEWC